MCLTHVRACPFAPARPRLAVPSPQILNPLIGDITADSPAHPLLVVDWEATSQAIFALAADPERLADNREGLCVASPQPPFPTPPSQRPPLPFPFSLPRYMLFVE